MKRFFRKIQSINSTVIKLNSIPNLKRFAIISKNLKLSLSGSKIQNTHHFASAKFFYGSNPTRDPKLRKNPQKFLIYIESNFVQRTNYILYDNILIYGMIRFKILMIHNLWIKGLKIIWNTTIIDSFSNSKFRSEKPKLIINDLEDQHIVRIMWGQRILLNSQTRPASIRMSGGTRKKQAPAETSISNISTHYI